MKTIGDSKVFENTSLMLLQFLFENMTQNKAKQMTKSR